MSSPPPPAPPSNKSSSSLSSSLLLDSRNDRNHSSNRRGRPSSSSNSNDKKKNNNRKKVVSFANPSIPQQTGHDEKFRNNMIDYKSSAGLLNEDEEDAFDPSVSMSMSTASSRASKKRNVLSLMDDTKHQDDGNEGGGGGEEEEEEVDEQYSLFHDEDYAAAAAAAATKNKGSSMSCPIEPFHMKAEREDGMGYFDGDTYIFRKSARRSGRGGMGMVGIDNNGDDNEEEDYGEDSWMNQVYVAPRDESKKARMDGGSSMLFKTNKDNNDNNNDNKHDEQTESLSKNEVYKELAGLLAHDSETVLQALTRYGSLWKRRRRPTKQSGFKKNIDDDNGNNNNNKRQRKTMDNGSDSIQPTNHDIAKTAFHRLTELSNLCMMKFDNGEEKIIYDWDRQTLMRHVYNHSGGGGGGVVMGGDDDCSKKSKSYFHDHHVQQQQQQVQQQQQQQVQWEYRGKVDHLIHGPFSTRQMMDWIQAGYFVGSNAVDVRQKKVAEEENGIVGRTGLQQLGIVVKKDNSNVVNDLLGDLEESDDEENDDNEKKEVKEEKHDKEEEMWQRSDQVDFAAYL